VAADEIVQAMLTQYSPGTPIGWHRDRPQFGTIVGISLASSCRMRLKPYQGEGKLISKILEPRSIYAMQGVARREFPAQYSGGGKAAVFDYVSYVGGELGQENKYARCVNEQGEPAVALFSA